MKEKKNDAFKQTIRFKRELGQHILKNPLILQQMVERSGLKQTDTVLEIGPGTGNLTVRLLERAKRVIAYEVDARLIAELHKRVTAQRSKLEIVIGDAIKSELPPYFDICVANIPYKISSPLIFKLLSHRPVPRCFVLMLQHEFAQRLIARPGDPNYCRLTCTILANVQHLLKVKRNNFKPPPKVDSSVVRIEPKWPPVTDIDIEEFNNLLRVCFNRKNRTMSAQLTSSKASKLLKLLERNYMRQNSAKQDIYSDCNSREQFKSLITQILKDSGFAEVRARTMDVDDFLQLLAAFNEKGVHF
ncbi:hypothetical protein GJ496_007910 [Pomphorhynchus laevis]|nr:hypothetical protein GJ496_007910 [Pomphorhynchus laevis]